MDLYQTMSSLSSLCLPAYQESTQFKILRKISQIIRKELDHQPLMIPL